MKKTGIVRKTDSFGRVVLPMELRRVLEIGRGTPIEISVDNDKIILGKYKPSCVFCGGDDVIFDYMDKKVCKICMDQITKK